MEQATPIRKRAVLDRIVKYSLWIIVTLLDIERLFKVFSDHSRYSMEKYFLGLFQTPIRISFGQSL